MAEILFLVHRLPYPPNKGDKVRSFHLMKHLAQSHRLHLGTFIDDPADEAHVDKVKSYCVDLHASRLTPTRAKLRSVSGLATGEALSLPYYRDEALRRWVDERCAKARMDAAVVFSSVMAEYVPDMNRLPTLVDFVDMDSAKWRQYASTHRWPLSWLYRREGVKLLEFERRVAARARRSFFVTEAECEMFRAAAPECAASVEPVGNGVDSEFFSPEHAFATPYSSDERAIVFTGAMDYWPNIDAAKWFAGEILPALRAACPTARFYVVGRSPDPAVSALAGADVVVTGTVADVRPYLAHAAAVVAPLRIARGIQNKVLEAMAMGKAVVASEACAGPIGATMGDELLAAGQPAEYVARIADLLADPARAADIGRAARERVLRDFSWDAHLSTLDRHLGGIVA